MFISLCSCIYCKELSSNSNFFLNITIYKFVFCTAFLWLCFLSSFFSFLKPTLSFLAKHLSQLNCRLLRPLFSRSQAGPLSPGSATTSSHQRDLASSQREKRAAPQPPAVNQTQDVRTLSVSPQRRPDNSDCQTVSGAVNEARHGKGLAPSRPLLAESRATFGAKTAPSVEDGTFGEHKQAAGTRSLNPFEDDMEDDDFTESRVRSAKKSRAPPLPTNTVKQNSAPPADAAMQSSVSESLGPEPKPAAVEKKEVPPPTTRR